MLERSSHCIHVEFNEGGRCSILYCSRAGVTSSVVIRLPRVMVHVEMGDAGEVKRGTEKCCRCCNKIHILWEVTCRSLCLQGAGRLTLLLRTFKKFNHVEHSHISFSHSFFPMKTLSCDSHCKMYQSVSLHFHLPKSHTVDQKRYFL